MNLKRKVNLPCPYASRSKGYLKKHGDLSQKKNITDIRADEHLSISLQSQVRIICTSVISSGNCLRFRTNEMFHHDNPVDKSSYKPNVTVLKQDVHHDVS